MSDSTLSREEIDQLLVNIDGEAAQLGKTGDIFSFEDIVNIEDSVINVILVLTAIDELWQGR